MISGVKLPNNLDNTVIEVENFGIITTEYNADCYTYLCI